MDHSLILSFPQFSSPIYYPKERDENFVKDHDLISIIEEVRRIQDNDLSLVTRKLLVYSFCKDPFYNVFGTRQYNRLSESYPFKFLLPFVDCIGKRVSFEEDEDVFLHITLGISRVKLITQEISLLIHLLNQKREQS